MQGTLRIEFLSGWTPDAAHFSDGLPRLSSETLHRHLTTAYRQMTASCPERDPDGQIGATVFGATARLTLGDATPAPEVVGWLRQAIARPSAVAVRGAFAPGALTVDPNLPLFSVLTAEDTLSEEAQGLLTQVTRLVRWFAPDGTGERHPVRLSVRWREPREVDGDPTGGREPRAVLTLQRTLYRQGLLGLLRETATEAARRAGGVPRLSTLERLRHALSDPQTWRETLKAWLDEENGTLRPELRQELRRATVGGSHLLTVLPRLLELKQTLAMGEKELAARESHRIGREETARRLWIEARETDEALRWFVDSLLLALSLRARGEELPAPPVREEPPQPEPVTPESDPAPPVDNSVDSVDKPVETVDNLVGVEETAEETAGVAIETTGQEGEGTADA